MTLSTTQNTKDASKAKDSGAVDRPAQDQADAEPRDLTIEPRFAMDDIQGDILVGLQKDAELLQFFRITDVGVFKAFVRSLPVTSAELALQRERAIDAIKGHEPAVRLPTPGLGIAFTYEGLQELGAAGLEAFGPGHPFRQGLAHRHALLNDASPADWKVLEPDTTVHGVFVVTGADKNEVTAAAELFLRRSDPTGWERVGRIRGKTRPGDERGHEHFGFLDGVSQPGIRGLIDEDTPLMPSRNPENPQQGWPGQDLLWPGEFVFGYKRQPTAGDDITEPGDPNEGISQHPSEGEKALLRNGSFLVVRRLEQKVPEFHKAVRNAADDVGIGTDLLGAQMVGRWTSGAPILNQGAHDQDKPEIGKDPMVNNDFEFGKDDAGAIVCPFAGHIRKAYSRDDKLKGKNSGDESEVETQQHRMMRRGIPFGIEVSLPERAVDHTLFERGLLFKCYVTDIERQFEHVQAKRVNDPDFVQNGAGVDSIIGQVAGGGQRRFNTRNKEGKKTIDFDPWVFMTGGGYFFAPSLSFLRSLA